MKTTKLTGHALDYAVAMCEGFSYELIVGIPSVTMGPENKFGGFPWIYVNAEKRKINQPYGMQLEGYRPSEDWALAGEIIEREGITIIRCDDDYATDKDGFTTTERIPVWFAEHGGGHSPHASYGSQGDYYEPEFHITPEDGCYGPAALIAAMRCYVAAKLGKEVEIPNELI
jgi:hypothetical protein